MPITIRQDPGSNAPTGLVEQQPDQVTTLEGGIVVEQVAKVVEPAVKTAPKKSTAETKDG